MSPTPVSDLGPLDLILTGSSREQWQRRTGRGREAGLRLLLLIPAGSLALAAALIAALALLTGPLAPAPAPDSIEADLEVWAESPVIEETPGYETTRRAR